MILSAFNCLCILVVKPEFAKVGFPSSSQNFANDLQHLALLWTGVWESIIEFFDEYVEGDGISGLQIENHDGLGLGQLEPMELFDQFKGGTLGVRRVVWQGRYLGFLRRGEVCVELEKSAEIRFGEEVSSHRVAWWHNCYSACPRLVSLSCHPCCPLSHPI